MLLDYTFLLLRLLSLQIWTPFEKSQVVFSVNLVVPSVERIVYSTCSIHQIENEDVIKSVLPLALKNGFELETPFPKWPRRGFPVFEGCKCFLRWHTFHDLNSWNHISYSSKTYDWTFLKWDGLLINSCIFSEFKRSNWFDCYLLLWQLNTCFEWIPLRTKKASSSPYSWGKAETKDSLILAKEIAAQTIAAHNHCLLLGFQRCGYSPWFRLRSRRIEKEWNEMQHNKIS